MSLIPRALDLRPSLAYEKNIRKRSQEPFPTTLWYSIPDSFLLPFSADVATTPELHKAVSACLTPAVSISRKVEPTACGDSVLVVMSSAISIKGRRSRSRFEPCFKARRSVWRFSD